MKDVMLALLLVVPVTASAQLTPSSASPEKRVRIFANASYNATTRSFEETTTFTQFLEEGSTRRSYDGGTGVGFEIGALYAITPELGVMGSFELVGSEHDATFDVTAPHPLLFNRSRSASDDLAGLEYSERALHVDAVYTVEVSSITVDVFAGPTFFFTETELLDEGVTHSVYPFDALELVNVSTVKLTDDSIGFNAGAAVTYRLTPVVGAAFQARFSRATTSVTREGGDPIDIDAGGFRLGGGIRLTF